MAEMRGQSPPASGRCVRDGGGHGIREWVARCGFSFFLPGGPSVTERYEHFRVERTGDVTIITPTVFDFLDQLTNLEAKKEFVQFAQTDKPTNLVVDFQNIQRFSTEFIGTLMSVKKQLGASGQMKLCAMQEMHREIFQLLNLDGTVFEIHEDAAKAVASFS
jgi:anti-anti-sigma regulatory factor